MPPEKFTVPDTVLVRELQSESVLLDLATETYFGLDDVGTRFWQALSQTHSVEGACDVLAGEFDVERSRLESDVRAFLGELARAGLVHVDQE
jgi:hypothetical protein